MSRERNTNKSVSLDGLLAQLNLEPPPESWRREWDQSCLCRPDPVPFLVEQYVAETSSRIRLPADQQAALIRSLRFFAEHPEWIPVAWHQHRVLFGEGRLPPDPVEYWPAPSPVDESAALYKAIIFLSGVPNVFDAHARRGIAPDVTAETLSDLAVRLRGFRSTRGYYGMESHNWMVHHFAGHLIQLGRLQYEMTRFSLPYRVFRSRSTPRRTIALAEPGTAFRSDGRHATASGGPAPESGWTSEWVEDEHTIRATPISPRGLALPTPVVLEKSEWSCALCKHDPVWDLHIPAIGRMDFNECGRSLRRAVACLLQYFPEFKAKTFTCHAWFLDTQLEDYLPNSSNIIRFIREVYLLPATGASDRGMKNRVFGSPDADVRFAPRDTTLRRAAAAHIEKGGFWYNGAMVLFGDDLDWGAGRRGGGEG